MSDNRTQAEPGRDANPGRPEHPPGFEHRNLADRVPKVGETVWYMSRTGNYYLPAIIVVTQDNLYQGGVDAGHIPALTSPDHVHLWVFSPGPAGLRADATDFVVESEHGRDENRGGGYNEFDIPLDVDFAPGTWRYPGDSVA